MSSQKSIDDRINSLKNTDQSLNIFASLIANESLTVVTGNYPTAAFDLQNRVVMLPEYHEELGLSTKKLFRGHEVGHAVFTPPEGYHGANKSNKEYRIYSSLLNIVEDARIERLILKKYPGLKRDFKRGYEELFERGFFGSTDPEKFKEYNFVDRLNIATKLRINDTNVVPFTDEEMPLVRRAMFLSTFDQVTELCKDILTFLKEKAEEQQEQQTNNGTLQSGDNKGQGNPAKGKGQKSDKSGDSEGEGSGGNSGSESDEKGSEDGSGDGAGDGESEDGSGGDDSGDKDSPSTSTLGKKATISDNTAQGSVDAILETLRSETDEAFRNNESNAIDYDASQGSPVVTVVDPVAVYRKKMRKSTPKASVRNALNAILKGA